MQNLVCEGQRTRVENPIGAEQTDKVALFLGASGCKHLGAEMLRNLDRGDAYSASGAVDEYPFARLQTCELREGIVRREKCRRYGGRRRKGPLGRFARDGKCLSADAVGKGRGGDRDHFVARGELDSGSDAQHYTRELHSKRGAAKAVLDRFVGQQSHRVHHVPEIEAGRSHLNLQFAALQRLRRALRVLPPPQQVAE